MSVPTEFDRDGERLKVQLSHLEDDQYRIRVGDVDHEVTARRLPDGRVRFSLAGQVYDAAASRTGMSDAAVRRGDVHVSLGEESWMLTGGRGRASRRADGHGSVGDGVIVAPMTGTVLSIAVKEGDAVAASDTVAVVTAMKMEHKLLAGVDGTVAEVGATAGAAVEQDQLLLRIEPTT